MPRSAFLSVVTVAVTAGLVAQPAGVTAQTAMTDVKVHLTAQQPDGGPFLVPVHREVEGAPAVAEAAIAALLDGATDAEAAGTPSLGSEIPSGTTLNGVTVTEGTATVDLSGHFDDGGGTATMLMRLAQVVFTVTQFPTVDDMLLELDGEPVEVFSSEGLLIEDPVGRAWFDGSGVLAPVFLDQPAWGGPFAARFVGTSATSEVRLTVVDNDGLIIAESVLSLPGAEDGTRVPFDVTLPYVSLTAQSGAVMAADAAGTAAVVVEHPVTLAPTPVPTARPIWRPCPVDAGSEPGFEDVPAEGAHAHAIACIVDWELAHGITEVTYAPDRPVTRGQMASFVDRMMAAAGQPLPDSAEDTFVDDDESVHEPAIERLAAAGLIEGVADDLYAPAQAVTRAQGVSLLWRAHEHLAGTALVASTDYYDDDTTSVHHAAINGLSLAGVTTGRDGDFEPLTTLTRAQMASVLARMLDLLMEQHVIP